MENEIWERHENNTNMAEAAHAQANREGKQLKLVTAIMRLDYISILLIYYLCNFNGKLIFDFRGRRLDERLFKVAEVHDKFGVPYTRKDKSDIKKKSIAMSRKGM